MDVCTSVGGSSAKQTGLTALIAVIPNTYVVSPAVYASLLTLSGTSVPPGRERQMDSKRVTENPFHVAVACVPVATTCSRVPSICVARETLVPVYESSCVCAFVLARRWIVTTAEDTRLNTPTIVTIERDDVFPLAR